MAIKIQDNYGVSDTLAELLASDAVYADGLIVLCIDVQTYYKRTSDEWVEATQQDLTAGGNTQEKLVSGTNIKTINSNSLLGSGNISISGGSGGYDGDPTIINQDSDHRFVTDTEKSTWNGKQNSLGFTPENVSNKSTNTSLGASDTLYPTQNAVKSYVDTGLSGKQNTLGFTPEDVSNKATSGLDTSTTKYPCNNVVKAAVDAKANISHTHNTEEINGLEDALSDLSGAISSKQDAFSNGYGLTGTSTKSVGLSYAQTFATGTTSINSATYIDITGCSVSLAAGTWIIYGHVVGAAANTIIQGFLAITDASNNVIAESAFSRPAAGTASLNSPVSASWFAIVTPTETTTYKLRGARGVTTHTGTYTVYDGNGYNTTSHATNNSDKGTSITAIRIV
jgi:hypothetical protein